MLKQAGIERYLIRLGNSLNKMNYATGYAMNIDELFLSFPTTKMTMTAKACEDLIGNRHKEIVAKKIFKSALNMVLEDIIENNATFLLPTRSKKAELKMKRFGREEFSRARRNGKWSKVDFLTSNFSAYQIVFNFQSKGVMREKLIYLDPEHRDRITDHTNQGKQYF